MATVLLIDDHTCSSRKLIQTLRATGYEVCVAIDADEAIRLFRLYPVDVVVLDCRLCRLSNTLADPAAVVRRLSPDTPIIMMSGYCGVPCRGRPLTKLSNPLEKPPACRFIRGAKH